MFIFKLPLDNDKKDELRKHERSICARWAVPFFLAAMAGKYGRLDDTVAMVVMPSTVCGVSFQFVKHGSQR